MQHAVIYTGAPADTHTRAVQFQVVQGEGCTYKDVLASSNVRAPGTFLCKCHKQAKHLIPFTYTLRNYCSAPSSDGFSAESITYTVIGALWDSTFRPN